VWKTRRTVCSATSAQNRVSAGVLDGGHDGTRWRSAFDKKELVLEVGLHILNTCRKMMRCQNVVTGRCDSIASEGVAVPSSLYRELETSFTHPSQVIGTAKVV